MSTTLVPVDLIGVTQIAELLGITRAGAHKLIERESTFPEPVAVIANRRVWDRDAVAKWHQQTYLRPENEAMDRGDLAEPIEPERIK